MRLIEQILARCRRSGTPLIEEGKAVFYWFGEDPPQLMGDFNGWDDAEPVSLTSRGKFMVFQLDLPDDAYVEYIFINDQKERVYDPLNHRKTSTGIGKTNQFFYMPKGRPTPFLMRRYGVAQGAVSHVVLQAGEILAGGKRSVHFYQPPVEELAPLLVVWDGGDYLRRAKLAVIVDNMIHARRIQPVALAMVENGGPARMVEYSCSEATLWFILQTLLPEACRHLNLVDHEAHPGVYGVMGASLGGLMAMYTGLRLPHIFGHVLAQSGSYVIEGFDFVTSTLVDHGPQLPLKIWMDAGKFEYLVEANRIMVKKLVTHGYKVEYHEYNGGHNYPAWRDDLPQWIGIPFRLLTRPVCIDTTAFLRQNTFHEHRSRTAAVGQAGLALAGRFCAFRVCNGLLVDCPGLAAQRCDRGCFSAREGSSRFASCSVGATDCLCGAGGLGWLQETSSAAAAVQVKNYVREKVLNHLYHLGPAVGPGRGYR